MATNKNIYNLGSLVKTSVDDYDFLETANSVTKVSTWRISTPTAHYPQ